MFSGAWAWKDMVFRDRAIVIVCKYVYTPCSLCTLRTVCALCTLHALHTLHMHTAHNAHTAHIAHTVHIVQLIKVHTVYTSHTLYTHCTPVCIDMSKKIREKTKKHGKIRPPGGACFLNLQASKPLPDRKCEPGRSNRSNPKTRTECVFWISRSRNPNPENLSPIGATPKPYFRPDRKFWSFFRVSDKTFFDNYIKF